MLLCQLLWQAVLFSVTEKNEGLWLRSKTVNACAVLPVPPRTPLTVIGPSWPEAVSHRSPRSITGRDQNGLLLDLGNVPIFAEILNVLDKGSGEESLDFLGFLTLPPTTSCL